EPAGKSSKRASTRFMAASSSGWTQGTRREAHCSRWGGTSRLPVPGAGRYAWAVHPLTSGVSTMRDRTPTRRDFLHRAAGLAAGTAGAAGAAGAEPAAERLLPTIKLGKHSVTRLIVGGNPVYGYSHFNRLLSGHQTAWHTP